ncbi:hypothetical protein IQ06DRAFT_369732 [Phaeosphaeriaceae sp. SRC1lsM3a]|nr:hypothetical protein IQ06DRAFT_369732 [Stagonospora sp. SRC1lsM3a]
MIGAIFIIVIGEMSVATAHAAKTVKFNNHCPYDMLFWPVGPLHSNIKGNDNDRIMVPNFGGSVIHNMHNTEALGGGMSLKLRDLPHYRVAPSGIRQVEYHLEPSRNSFWYDLSAIDCVKGVDPADPSFCPFVDGGTKLYGRGSSCPKASCSKVECENTYMHEGSWLDEPTFGCRAGADLFIGMCTENAGQRSQCDDGVAAPPSLVVSPDGACGGSTGFTCRGSPWGECCSQHGTCGNSPQCCGAGCQSSHGVCSGDMGLMPMVPESCAYASALKVSPIGLCGAASG